MAGGVTLKKLPNAKCKRHFYVRLFSTFFKSSIWVLKEHSQFLSFIVYPTQNFCSKQVTTKSKNKKARTVEEVEEEETENETVRFWEVPLVLDKIDISTLPDTTLALADKVTLREIEAPTVPDLVGIDASVGILVEHFATQKLRTIHRK